MGELDDFMDQIGGHRSASGTPPAYTDPSFPEPQNKKKRKNAKEPETNKKPKVMENRAIWISNLPPDTTKKELEEEFCRYGIIDKGANGEPRIRLEEKDGVFTGNAMIVYFKKEAIPNAVRLRTGFPLRPGDTTHGDIHVEPASIETKKERDGDKIASKLSRQDRKASERNRAELLRKLNEWSDNEEEVAETFVAKKNKWAKFVIIKNIFDLDQLEDDPAAYLEIKADMSGAAEASGKITKCTLYDREPGGIVTVRFREFEDAEDFVAKFQGKRYNHRALQLSLAEDKPRFKKSGRAETPDSDDEELPVPVKAKA